MHTKREQDHIPMFVLAYTWYNGNPRHVINFLGEPDWKILLLMLCRRPRSVSMTPTDTVGNCKCQNL